MKYMDYDLIVVHIAAKQNPPFGGQEFTMLI